MKNLGIHLKKTMQNLYTQIYKTMLRDIKKISLHGKKYHIPRLKVIILCTSIYSFITIQIKSQQYFINIGQLILKII